MTDQTTPSQRAGLRDEIVQALGRIKTVPPVAHRREQADHVLAVLYRLWPWLRAEAEDAAPGLSPAADQAAEIERMRERHKASLRRADEINNQLMEEVQRYVAGTERPVLWSVYNRMHQRAIRAEGRSERVQGIVRRLAAHAVGFQDVLDDSDRGPWGKTVSTDIAELIEVLSDQSAAEAPAPPAVGAQQPKEARP